MTTDDILNDIIDSKPGSNRTERLWSALTDIGGGHNVNAAIDIVDLFAMAAHHGFIQWAGADVQFIDAGEGGFTLTVNGAEVTVEAIDRD